MSIKKFTGTLYKAHIIISLMIALFMSILILIFPDQQWYQIAISILIILFYWYYMYANIIKDAESDAKFGNFKLSKAFAAAAFFNIPSIILFFLSAFENKIFTDSNLFRIIFRFWNCAYLNPLSSLNDPLWLMASVIIISFPAVAACYYGGVIKKKKVDALIHNMNDNTSDGNKNL